MEIGERIRAFRKEKGITQRDFAGRLGYSDAFLSEIERGVKEPSREFLKKLNEVFGISSDYILYGNESNKTSDKENLISAVRDQPLQYEIAAHERERRSPENATNRKIINKVVKILNNGNTKIVRALKANIEAFLLAIENLPD